MRRGDAPLHRFAGISEIRSYLTHKNWKRIKSAGRSSITSYLEMSESKYEVIVYWDKADEIFVAEVPELSGCMAHGKTKSEAIAEAEAAIELWIETAQADGLAIPEPRGRLLFA